MERKEKEFCFDVVIGIVVLLEFFRGVIFLNIEMKVVYD